MILLFCRKKRCFSTTSTLRDRYFGFPPLHRKSQQSASRWRVLAFYRIAPCLKWGSFIRLRVKHSNHLHTELSLGYLEDANLYVESKASFIDISSIASFKLFLILYFFGQFRGWFQVLAWPKYTQLGTIFQQKKSCSISNFFFFLKYVLY